MFRSYFQVGILDFCLVSDAIRPSDAIWRTIELVPHVEAMGYSRYWLGEHHTNDVAHSSPEMLVPVLAGVSTRIRVGTAGILLRYHSPFKVASNFRLLQSIFPNRIDLGLARGGVPEDIRRLLLGENNREAAYDMKIEELLTFLRGTGEVSANPQGVCPPNIWILGNKSTSMLLAARNGTAFCLTLFLDEVPKSTAEVAGIIDTYRNEFRPSKELAEPRWSIAIAGVCADHEEQARLLASTARGVFPSVLGTPSQCRSAFEELSEKCQTREFIFLDVNKHVREQLYSYQLLSTALQLLE